MQGVLLKQKCGYKWMRIGYADSRFSTTLLTLALSLFILLAIWTFKEIPKTEWRWLHFLTINVIGLLVYTNLCVWLHEQFHCLAYKSTPHAVLIFYERKYLLFLRGHYRVKGGINYTIMTRALLGPLLLSVSLIGFGLLGHLFLPSWWLPYLMIMALFSLIDMMHDFYMYSQIRAIGNQGKYWDRGKYLELVWKGSFQEEIRIVEGKL